jgi:peptidoglycan hydrolase-like protein with peptidoglycan-binding domain
LYGSLPMYRSLESGVEGGDVEQFETNLRQLGFTGFTVDRHFNADTQNAVRRWQRQLGAEATGVVDQARVTYSGAAVRIDEVLERVGSSAPADLLAVTSTTRVVRATVPSATAGWATIDAAVMVVPVGGAAVAGTVAAVTPAPSTDGDANPSVTVTVAVADQASLTARDAVIRYVIEERRDVLTVPVSALLALPEGGYGLELVDGRLVRVEVGLFADGQVEISGASVSEGLEVGMPA